MRLIFSEKAADDIFNVITATTMAVFGLEVIINTLGKQGYLCGFFFWLDAGSTVTLILDLTYVSETLFGDTISIAEALSSEGTPGEVPETGPLDQSSSQSADAARAARMSRVGTKAGRVVRLLRLVRLIRLVKFYQKNTSSPKYKKGEDGAEASPGMDWEEDDDDMQKESAVSKKLSEMTTRRVVMLVLVIMLALPFFQPGMYNDDLSSSAQYGINVLYRRWRDDMSLYEPYANATAEAAYLSSKGREVYVDDFYLYAYYHSPFTQEDLKPSSAVSSPLSSFNSLFFAGIHPDNSTLGQYFLPSFEGRGNGSYDPNARFAGNDWLYYMGNMTSDPESLFSVAYANTTSCVNSYLRGISLLAATDSYLDCPEKLRYNERSVIVPTAATSAEYEEVHFMFVFDRRSGAQLEAILNTAQTVFICFLLGFGAMTFSQDANRLVLTPIERMISKLDKIRNNPLEAMTIGDEEHHREQVRAIKRGQQRDPDAESDAKRNCCSRCCSATLKCIRRRSSAPKQIPEPMETVVLEKTIIKIGSLLALGFGEAGAEIIGQNMRGGDSAALNAMIPGRRVEAIFGFCDIRNFTDATEVLQDQVMVFVNRIASVIHSCVNEFFGNPNKNIGEAFLLTWRLSDYGAAKQKKMADMSLLSFIKIIAQINKSPLLAEYRNHPKLAKRLPNYRVRMGFGLHSGWAIEGAIGSEFKIDASYLSPNVNMAARLEAVTKQYGCLILMTDAIIKLMSVEVAEECRIIDHVRLSATKEPFKLYTYDLNDLALEVEQAPPPPAVQGILSDGRKTGDNLAASREAAQKKDKYRLRHERERTKAERWSDDFQMCFMLTRDADIMTMRNKFTSEFFCRFNMAYLNYEAGEWGVAKDMLEVTRFLLATEDGPSAALLRFMKQYDWEAPAGWTGYRVLHDK